MIISNEVIKEQGIPSNNKHGVKSSKNGNLIKCFYV